MTSARRLVWTAALSTVFSACVAGVRLGPDSSDAQADAPGTTGGKSGTAGVDAHFDVASAGADGVAGTSGSGGAAGAGSGGSAGQPDLCNATPSSGTVGVTLAGAMGVGGAGGAAPATGQVIVIWASDTAPGSNSYLWGKGTYTSPNYSIDLNTQPPPDALFGGSIAIGHVALVDDAYVYEPKLLNSAGLGELQAHLLGWNFVMGVVWKPTSAGKLGYWPDAFGDQYSCSGCCFFKDNNPACCYQPGSTYDALTPASCSNIALVAVSSAVTVCKYM